MNAKLTFLETLVPILARLASSPDKSLAAEAADEHAAKARELAKLKRAAIPADVRRGEPMAEEDGSLAAGAVAGASGSGGQ